MIDKQDVMSVEQAKKQIIQWLDGLCERKVWNLYHFILHIRGSEDFAGEEEESHELL